MGVSTAKRAASDAQELARQQQLYTTPGTAEYQNPDTLAFIQHIQNIIPGLAHKAAATTSYNDFFNSGIGRLLSTAGEAAAAYFGGPLGAAAATAGVGALQGQREPDIFRNAGLAAAGTEIAPVLGNEFASIAPETAESLGIGGGANSLTDAFGQTTGGGSWSGPGTIGGLASNLYNFTADSGLSQMLGGTPQSATDLGTAYNGFNSDVPNANAPALDASATAPSNLAQGGDYGAGGSPVPGAASGPGAIAPTAGGGGGGLGGGAAPAATGLSSGENVADTGSAVAGAQGSSLPWQEPGYVNPSNVLTSGTQDFLNGLGQNSTGAGTESLNPAVIQASNAATPGGTDLSLNQPSMWQNMIGSTSPVPQTLSSGGNVANSGLSQLLGGGASPINGLVNGGLSMLLGNNNQKGMNQITNAAQSSNANYQPYLTAGTGAENQLSNLYGNNGSAAQTAAMKNFQVSPGYDFALNQGLNAVNANAAAMGNPLSGNNEEAINNYAQGTATQQYNNYINQLQNMASGGMNAASGISQNNLTGSGAQAQAGQNQANIQNTALGTGLNALFPTGINIAQLLAGQNAAGGGAGLLGMLGLS